MSDMEPKKMKVAELREELKTRGFDTKGNKAQLVKRLEKALKAEAGGDDADTSLQDDSLLDSSQANDADDSIMDTSSSMPEEAEPVEAAPSEEPETVYDTLEEDAVPEPEPEQDNEVEEEIEEASPAVVCLDDDDDGEKTEEEEMPEEEAMPEQEAVPEDDGEKTEDEEEIPEEVKQEEVNEEISMESEEKQVEKQEVVEASADPAVTEEEAPKSVKKDEEGDGDEVEEFQVMDAIGESEIPELDQEPEASKPNRKRSHPRDDETSKSGRSRSRSPRRRSHGSDRERRNRSGDRYRGRSHSNERAHKERPVEPEENEDWLAATNVVFDRYNCDLNIRVDDSGFKCCPVTVEGFGFMWAGSRTNYGVNKGKVGYEMKVIEELNVNHLPAEETSRHVVRVGFSTNSTSMQLGEEKFSYGYGGTAKMSEDCKFQDYGETFGNGDVIGAYVDFESEPVQISYTKNGTDLGKAFEIEVSTLKEGALFPHILTKNCEFECNFGEKEEPFFPVKEGFTFINAVPVEDRVRGSAPPEKKEDCEIIMMCGLPGAGKTVWATKYAVENPEKKYNILGTNNIIDKMKVMGLPRKKNYAGRWDVLIDKSTKCLNRMLEISSKKKRNYILDQTNVYPSAQRRKMRPFEGFQRKAIVIVPTDEEYKKRCEKREKEEGKDVPDSAVLEMKANFQLPEEGPVFDKVDFIELEKEEAQKVVDDYNIVARALLPPPEKRFRDNDRWGGGNRYGGRDNRGGRDNHRGNQRYDSRDRGRDRGYDKRGGRGSYMGYSDRDRQRVEGSDRRETKRYDRNDKSSSGSYNRNQSWNNHGSGSWQGNQGWSGNQGWGNQGGSWNNQGYSGNWNNQWSGYQGNQGGNNSSGGNWGQNYGNWNNSGYNNQNSGQGNWSGYYGNYNYGNYQK